MNSDYLKQLGDQIALAHWAKSNETTYEEICDRVVNYICDDPSEEGRHYNHRMKDLLKQKKFIPNSPCWINAGTDMKNLFACYVIDLKDSMDSIMDTAKRMAMIMKEGGGVGVSLTPIRAEGSRVGGEGSERTASGPISFLKVFDAVVGAVKSAGVRRGAALANLKVGHPDLVKFIKCKEDQNQINNFNLSVAITDEFMDDVINKSAKPWVSMKLENGEVEDWTAEDIYNLIVEHMWRNGEPGVQFMDAVNNVDGKYTGRPEFIEFNTGIEVSNPCVTGETCILTKEYGIIGIGKVAGKEVSVWNGKRWSKTTPFSTGVNDILCVTIANDAELGPVTGCFAEGQREHDTVYIRCTKYHKFILSDGSRKEAKDLVPGDRLIDLDCNLLDENMLPAPEKWLEEQAKATGLSLETLRADGIMPGFSTVRNNIVKAIDVDVIPQQETFCLTESEEHAFTVIAGNFSSPLLIGNCGESFLKPNEACNLGSINLYHFVNPFWKGKDENKDMALRQELKQTVEDAVDFLNLMVDKSETPFDEINKAVKASRKVGLGVMGLADYLSAKGLVYGSPEAIHEAADIFAFITKTAEEHSLRKGYKNACLTIQAPTGTTGLVGEVSTGIEPHFLRCWNRKTNKMGNLLMYPKSLRDYIKDFSEEIDDTPDIQEEIKEAKTLRQAMDDNNFVEFSKLLEADTNVADEIRKYWPTAHEVTPKQHLAMLAAIQRHVHNSVSKTINLPHDATVEDVRELIMTAWRTGVKGFTCYRDGSRDSQPLKSIKDVNNNIIGSVFKDKLGHSLLIKDTGDNLVNSLEHCNIRCDIGNVEFVLKPVASMEEVKEIATESDKKFEESKDKIETNDDLINHIRLDMTEKKRLEYLEKMSDKEPVFADTILKALAFDKILKGIDKTLLPAENIILSDTPDSKIFADKIRSKMADDLQKELKDEEEEKMTLTKREYEALSKFAELGYEYVVDCYSDKLVTDVLKERQKMKINKEAHQEQKASCKRPRPAVTHGESIRTKIGCGTMYITVNRDDKGICEVFTSLGRSGGCPSQSEATSRLISLALRSGVSLDDIIDQLKGIRCLNTMRQGGMKQEDGTIVLSCPDAIGKAIEKVRKDEEAATADLMKHFIDDPDSHISDEDLFKAIFPDPDSYVSDEELKAGFTLLRNKGMSCPKCGEQMDRDGGCVICRHCGYSKCG